MPRPLWETRRRLGGIFVLDNPMQVENAAVTFRDLKGLLRRVFRYLFGPAAPARSFAGNTHGTAKIEYALLIFIIGIAVIGTMQAIGLSLGGIYQLVVDNFVPFIEGATGS